MSPPDPPRLCTSCRIHHIENCERCLGWGLQITANYPEGVPIFAHMAHHESLDDVTWIPCPVCQGTPLGREGP
jgi:hypothetical protein